MGFFCKRNYRQTFDYVWHVLYLNFSPYFCLANNSEFHLNVYLKRFTPCQSIWSVALEDKEFKSTLLFWRSLYTSLQKYQYVQCISFLCPNNNMAWAYNVSSVCLLVTPRTILTTLRLSQFLTLFLGNCFFINLNQR